MMVTQAESCRMPRRRITVGFAAGEEPTLTLETKIRNSRDASVSQCYSKRRTDELKPPDAQTVALGSPAELSRNSRMNHKKKGLSLPSAPRCLGGKHGCRTQTS